MHILIGDQKVDLTEGSNGRLQATFTATEDTQSIRIPSDCIGTLKVNDIQLEQGPQATPFVEPAVHTEDISGIFKDLHELRIGIKDTQEGLSHQITINQEGLEQLISDTEERLNSRITLTADTWQGELSNTERGLSNEITSTANFWQRKLTDTERGLRSVIQAKADGFIALIEDTEEGLSNQIVANQEGLEQLVSNTEERLDSRITLMADTWQGELSDAKRGLNNQITATAELWQAKLSDTEQDLRSAIQLKADSLIALVEDTEEGLDNQIAATASLWQTKLSDTERGLRNVIQARADGLIKLIEDTDSANFTKTEQLVNGLKTTVQGDLRSQRVQLENLISSSIESATGERSTIWQTLNSHGSQISNAQGDISRVEQTVSGYSRRISDVEGKYSSIEQTVSGLNTEVNGYNGVKSRVRQLEGLIDQRVTRGDVEGIIQNSGDSIWLAIGSRVQSVADNTTMSGDEIISEINLSRDGARISGKNIFLDSNVTWTRDFRTRFASVIELRADQITSGTIDASRIRVINLDVNSLTGNRSEWVRAGFNSINSRLTVTGDGIRVFDISNDSTELRNGGLHFHQGSTYLGYIGSSIINQDRQTIGGISVNLEPNQGFMIAKKTSSLSNYSEIMQVRPNSMNLRMNAILEMNHNLDMRRFNILNTNRLEFQFGTSSITGWGSTGLTIQPEGNLQIRTSGTQAIEVLSRTIHFTRALNMNGNGITNQSDARLKTNIRTSYEDSLSKFKQISYKHFEYRKGHNLAEGVQHGVIAQDILKFAPEWVLKDDEGYYLLDNSAMQMDGFKAITDLVRWNIELESRIEELEDKLERVA